MGSSKKCLYCWGLFLINGGKKWVRVPFLTLRFSYMVHIRHSLIHWLIWFIFHLHRACTHTLYLFFFSHTSLCQIPHPFFCLSYTTFSPHPYFHFLSPLPDSFSLSQSTEFSGNPSQSLRRPFTLGGTFSPPVAPRSSIHFPFCSSPLFSYSLPRSHVRSSPFSGWKPKEDLEQCSFVKLCVFRPKQLTNGKTSRQLKSKTSMGPGALLRRGSKQSKPCERHSKTVLCFLCSAICLSQILLNTAHRAAEPKLLKPPSAASTCSGGPSVVSLRLGARSCSFYKWTCQCDLRLAAPRGTAEETIRA